MDSSADGSGGKNATLRSTELAKRPAVERDSRMVNEINVPWLRRRPAGIRPPPQGFGNRQ